MKKLFFYHQQINENEISLFFLTTSSLTRTLKLTPASPFAITISIIMCRTVYWKSPTCEHRWLSIGQPCPKDAGFDKCKALKTKGLLPFTPGGSVRAAHGTCPKCDLKGKYDGNMVRMLSSHSYRVQYPVQKGPKKFVYVNSGCTMM